MLKKVIVSLMLVFCFCNISLANDFGVIIDYILYTQPNIDNDTAYKIATGIIYCSKKYNINKEILIAICKVESHFKPYVISKKGAIGIMQIMYNIHKDLLDYLGITKRQLFNPYYNIIVGSNILINYGICDDVENALYLYSGKSKKYVNKIKQAILDFIFWKQTKYLEVSF